MWKLEKHEELHYVFGGGNKLFQKLTAEMFGTFALVFAGTGAIIINDVSGGIVTHIGIAVTFGLIVMTMIYALGDVSGAHFNPAVTLGFLAAKRVSPILALQYICSQLAGAFLASAILYSLFPSHGSLGATFPSGPPTQSFVLEIILTMILMFVILSVATGAKERGLMAGVAIGGVVGLEAMFAGPISGASMNPARSIAPAVVSGHLEGLWIYLVAPVLGSLFAVLLAKAIFTQK